MVKISSDKSKLDIDFIYNELNQTYWASDRTLSQVLESIENSLCFGVYLNGCQIGFARVVTDKVIFSYIMDVLIQEKYKGLGYGTQLFHYIYQHKDLLNVKNHYLHTKDAQDFYKRLNFNIYDKPNRFMVKYKI